jgi:hypothetical protein
MPELRRFPRPSLEEMGVCVIVRDANGQRRDFAESWLRIGQRRFGARGPVSMKKAPALGNTETLEEGVCVEPCCRNTLTCS